MSSSESEQTGKDAKPMNDQGQKPSPARTKKPKTEERPKAKASPRPAKTKQPKGPKAGPHPGAPKKPKRPKTGHKEETDRPSGAEGRAHGHHKPH